MARRSPKMEKHIAEIRAVLEERGFKRDRFGHMHKTVRVINEQTGARVEQHYRYAFRAGSLRREVKAGDRWVRLRSARYGQVRVTEDRKLAGLVRNP